MASLLRAAGTWGLFPWRGYCSRGTQVGGGDPAGGWGAGCQVSTRLRAAPEPYDLGQQMTGLTVYQALVLRWAEAPSAATNGAGGCKIKSLWAPGRPVQNVQTHFETMPGR